MIKPMIEPIFVILGILASPPPRLAATREDAEISAAVANLRTLVSDASAYYTVKGTLGAGNTAAKWNEITNVSLKRNANGDAVDSSSLATASAYLKVGDANNCITVQLVNKTVVGVNTAPAHIKFTKVNRPNGVCAQVLAAAPLKPYFNLPGATSGTIAIGSSTKIH